MIPTADAANHRAEKHHRGWSWDGLQAAKKWIRVIFPGRMTIGA
jgi:hypothetical protein